MVALYGGFCRPSRIICHLARTTVCREQADGTTISVWSTVLLSAYGIWKMVVGHAQGCAQGGSTWMDRVCHWSPGVRYQIKCSSVGKCVTHIDRRNIGKRDKLLWKIHNECKQTWRFTYIGTYKAVLHHQKCDPFSSVLSILNGNSPSGSQIE